MDTLKKHVPKLISFSNTVLKHTAVYFIFSMVSYLFIFFAQGFTAEERKFWLVFLAITTYLSTAFAFALYNQNQCKLFLGKNKKDVISELLSFDFFVDQIGMAVFFVIFSAKLLSLTAVIAAFIANIFTYVYARSIWLNHTGNRGTSLLFTAKLIIHLVLSIPGLFILFFLLSSIIPSIPTIIMVLKLLSFTLIIPLILAVFLYIRALNKMRKFLSSFKRFCKNNSIKVPNIKKPYLSVFMLRPENTFEIEIQGKIYACVLASFTNIFRPVIFKNDGYLYRISAKALKRNEKPTLIFETKYGFESKRQKIIIITSVPYVVKLQEGTLSKTFDNGDMCGEYKIFTPKGFYGAAERNTLARKTYD